jgi:hypothetical protein
MIREAEPTDIPRMSAVWVSNFVHDDGWVTFALYNGVATILQLVGPFSAIVELVGAVSAVPGVERVVVAPRAVTKGCDQSADFSYEGGRWSWKIS